MNLFGSEEITSKLGKRSESIKSVFTKTVNDLAVVNEDASARLDKNNEELERLNAENAKLEKIVAKNEKFMDKVMSFFDDSEDEDESDA